MTEKVTMPQPITDTIANICAVNSPSKDIYNRPEQGKTWGDVLMVKVQAPFQEKSKEDAKERGKRRVELRKWYKANKAELPPDLKDAAPSAVVPYAGLKEHPFNMRECSKFKYQNSHHAACINAKVSASVGLGHKDGLQKNTDEKTGKVTKRIMPSKADKALSPLCFGGWRATLLSLAEDFWQTHIAYLEIVRDKSGKIVGIHHMPSHSVWVYVEDGENHFHYQVLADDSISSFRKFAAFGDKQSFLLRNGLSPQESTKYSELIAFRRPSSLSKWYGFPDWISCVPDIELSQMVTQQKFDFFNNRGVPEFMLFLLGKKLTPEQWSKVENALASTIGAGNQHKSLALNIEDKDMKVEMHKLAMESKSDNADYSELKESLGLSIVTAHGTPPLVAGVVVPGRIGSSNELPNALMLFELIKIGPVQGMFEQVLAATLAHPQLGVQGLQPDDFLLLRITDFLDLGENGIVQTLGAMREPLASGRDPADGLKQH